MIDEIEEDPDNLICQSFVCKHFSFIGSDPTRLM